MRKLNESMSRLFIAGFSIIVLCGCSVPMSNSSLRSNINDYLILEREENDILEINLELGLGFSVREAVVADDSYLEAVSLERAAKNQVDVARSSGRLQFRGNTNIGVIKEVDDPIADSTTSGVSGGLSISKLLYDGGRTASEINKSSALAISAQANREVKGNEIALSAAQSWIDLWQYGERLRLIRERTSVMGTLVDQIGRMATSGMLDRASVDAARRQIVDVKLEEMKLVTEQSKARLRFKSFFHKVSPVLTRPAELIDADRARRMLANLPESPTLVFAAANVLAERAALESARSEFRPQAFLRAGLQSPWEENESTDVTSGVSIEYTFNDGGRRQNALAAATERLEASEARFRDIKNNLKTELNSQLQRLTSIEDSIPLLQEKLRLSQSEAQASRSQLLTGQSNLRFLVEAEIEIYRAQDQEIKMQAERQVVLLTIVAGTGDLAEIIGL